MLWLEDERLQSVLGRQAAALAMIRDHARAGNRKVVDVAAAVVGGHRLLPKQPRVPAGE